MTMKIKALSIATLVALTLTGCANAAMGPGLDDPIYYTVSFNIDGTITTQEVESGKTVAKPADPTKAEYSFAGWYTTAELELAYDFTTPVTSSFTLFADWSALPRYTVTFDYGGSTVSSQVIQGNLASKPTTDPTNEHHNFLGWYNGETKYEFTTPVTEDITLTAKWTNTETTYGYTSINNGTLGRLTMKTGAFTLQYDDDPLNTDGTFDDSYSGTYTVVGTTYTFTWGSAWASYQVTGATWTRSTGSTPGAFLRGFGTAAVATKTTTVTTLDPIMVEVE